MQSIESTFDSEGLLASVIGHYVPRMEQITMAKKVAEALNTGRELIVEAGTGTGKTYAYLVPVLLSGQRVIVSTGTKHLQDQLYHRDLPILSQALGRPVKIALLKGRANYLCKHRLQLAQANPQFPGLESDARKRLPLIEKWALTTEVGDIAECAELAESDPVWTVATSTRENCLGVECPQYQRCHLLAARKQAQSAHVVIVNHHLLLADLTLKEEGFGELLPGADAIVIDEAHQFPDTAAHFFGSRFSSRAFIGLGKDTRFELQRLGQLDQTLEAGLRSLESRLNEMHQHLKGKHDRLDWHEVPGDFLQSFNDWQIDFSFFAKRIGEIAQAENSLKALARRTEALAVDAWQMNQFDAELGLQWVEVHPYSFSIEWSPFEVAKRLADQRVKQPRTWIYTSATLAVGDDFSHFSERIGSDSPMTLRLDSPFEFRDQARLWVPLELPEPQLPGHTEAVLQTAWPLVETAEGRTFMLFTSHRALNVAARWVRERLAHGMNYPLLVQGDAPRDTLIRQFREAGNAILLGTASFWEGVDVRGEALSVVIIDKLPFQSPDDPLLRARLKGLEQRGLDAFRSVQLPQAVLALKQGIGRLIRDHHDYGVVMIGDRRLRTKGYGKVVLKALPPMPLVDDFESARQFLLAHRQRYIHLRKT